MFSTRLDSTRNEYDFLFNIIQLPKYQGNPKTRATPIVKMQDQNYIEKAQSMVQKIIKETPPERVLETIRDQVDTNYEVKDLIVRGFYHSYKQKEQIIQAVERVPEINEKKIETLQKELQKNNTRLQQTK